MIGERSHEEGDALKMDGRSAKSFNPVEKHTLDLGCTDRFKQSMAKLV
jgi:hypothetical protein